MILHMSKVGLRRNSEHFRSAVRFLIKQIQDSTFCLNVCAHWVWHHSIRMILSYSTAIRECQTMQQGRRTA